MKESSASQRVGRDEGLPVCILLRSPIDEEQEIEAWYVNSSGRHDFLKVSPSSAAPAHGVFSPTSANCNICVSSLPARLQPTENHCIGNVLDQTAPDEETAIDEALDMASNTEKGTSLALSNVDAEANKKRMLCTPSSSASGGHERLQPTEEHTRIVLEETSPDVRIAIDERSPMAMALNEETGASVALSDVDERSPMAMAPNEETGASVLLSDVDAEANNKKRKHGTPGASANSGHDQVVAVVKKARKKPVNIWAKTSSSRKGGKKNSKNATQSNLKNATLPNNNKEDHVWITLASKHEEKIEDGPDLPVVLSKFHKAERIELSPDRLKASNTKGYRMVRATRGVLDGAWYFEILVEKLGLSGHTRLGWSTQKGEIQGPVGFDNYSYAYRDVDGSKVHMAVRETYGQPYMEGDVLGFYINLPNGAELAPKPPTIVSYRGQPYILEEKEDPPNILPGSEIAFFKNGICQGAAFKDLNADRYFPAASMYTLPSDPECVVKFNFGPEFRFPPQDFGQRPIPKPISCAPHCGINSLGHGSIAWKNEPSLDAALTPEPQRTGEVHHRAVFVIQPYDRDMLLFTVRIKASDAQSWGACYVAM